jgi:5-methylcytosine-specific restriction endonuclease McrA
MAKKYTLQEVSDIVCKNNCVLLSKKYLGNAYKLKIKCVCKNIFEKALTNFVKYPKCKKCFKKQESINKKFSFEEVFNYFKDHGCLLLNEVYEHSQIPLDYICECGNKSKIIFNSFRHGTRCKECGKSKMWAERRPKTKDIQQKFINEGCVLLDKYLNCSSEMLYICKCGNKSKISWTRFKKGTRCENCSSKKQVELEYLQECFRLHNCELLEKEYKNNSTKMIYRCCCGNVAETKWMHFKRGHRCKQCKIIKLSGENSHNWNPNKTHYERIEKRSFIEYKKWRHDVFKRDNYTCDICLIKGGCINAHHLLSYADNPNFRLELNNGITLCEKCHCDFHIAYGKGKNTQEQYNEFKKNKFICPFYSVT